MFLYIHIDHPNAYNKSYAKIFTFVPVIQYIIDSYITNIYIIYK
jgi:hypothetical protein